MTLSINTNRALFTISSTLLDSFIASPASYTDIKIQIYQNDVVNSTIKTYTSTNLITSSTDVATIAGVEYINPSFLNASEFVQGVYDIIVTLTSPSQIQTDEGCFYVENGLKCQIDDILVNESKSIEERILEGLKYQSLISATDCVCKCKEKIQLYLNLIKSISNQCQTC